MIPELGQFCLCIALMVSLLQCVLPAVSRYAGVPLGYLTKPLATACFLLVASAFAALLWSHAVSDFSVLTVVENSHSTKPLLYKIVGAWGNHEGSMLLWMLVLSAGGFLVAWTHAPNTTLQYATLRVLGLMAAGFLAFILFTSNPFLRVFPPPFDGEDLNPILQDIGLAFHPPTLYVGYVGYGIVFAYAIAGLLTGTLDRDWARTVRLWVLLPWSFLTLGIGAGSWWAYRELGWGGWWFWDPVENVSLLPWLVGTALLHSNLVLERRGQLASWVALLAILAFTCSLIGTFIVRSGLITSVHAFASDPLRGAFILAYIVVASGGALTVWGLCETRRTAPVALASRSGLILINNLILVASAAVVLFALLYPIGLQLLHRPSISVGPDYFNRTILPMAALLPLLAALAPLLAWDKATRPQFIAAMRSLAPGLVVALVVGLAIATPPDALLLTGIALAAWLLVGTARYVARVRRADVAWLSPAGLRHVAAIAAHSGFALFIIGMTFTATLKQTYDAPLDARTPIQLGDYTLRVVGARRLTHANYTSRRADITVSRGGHYITTLSPELRYYPVRRMQTTEAALYSTPLRDLYLVLGEASYRENKTETPLGIRLYVTPGQQLVWAGFVLVALGGLISIAAILRKENR
ncbi:MAG: heme lyase CcmF/NrfE family subunit [Rickettsiales bacterium]